MCQVYSPFAPCPAEHSLLSGQAGEELLQRGGSDTALQHGASFTSAGTGAAIAAMATGVGMARRSSGPTAPVPAPTAAAGPAPSAAVASSSGVVSRAPQKYLIQNQSGMKVFYWTEGSKVCGGFEGMACLTRSAWREGWVGELHLFSGCPVFVSSCGLARARPLPAGHAPVPPLQDAPRSPVYCLDSGGSENLRVVPASKRLSFVQFGSSAVGSERVGATINLHFEGNWMPVVVRGAGRLGAGGAARICKHAKLEMPLWAKWRLAAALGARPPASCFPPPGLGPSQRRRQACPPACPPAGRGCERGGQVPLPHDLPRRLHLGAPHHRHHPGGRHWGGPT